MENESPTASIVLAYFMSPLIQHQSPSLVDPEYIGLGEILLECTFRKRIMDFWACAPLVAGIGTPCCSRMFYSDA